MSTWTNEKHEDARRALEEDMSQWGMEYGGGALDEIERQRTALDHEALEKLRLWLEDMRENHPRFADEMALFLLMLERFKADNYPKETPDALP